MKDELLILKSQAEINRGLFRSKLVKNKKASDNQQEFSAASIGYDSATGRHIVKRQDGSIIHALAITNGGIARGSKVSLGISSTGIPVADQMPR